MNPKLPLQIHLKNLCQEREIFSAQSIYVLLDLWKEDYDLICEIQANNKCNICDDDLHWIHKLNCPQKIYAEAFKFKRLYEVLLNTIEIAKCNKDYLSLFESYIPQSENDIEFDKWTKSVMTHKSNIDDLRFQLLNTDFFIIDDKGELQKVKPNIGSDFDFEIYIEAKYFSGIFKLSQLINNYTNEKTI
ncbi:hypothetical protein [Flavobacterium covae]|uniref:hypothetical protein n=1 Tax=Flavobacterium covae TaxID=2906076 RepID=UPI000745C629|nr:hypothetical protein [Flavobacterium covae]AMA49975.1 hypothetical protein AWN65_11160 [Flavobacterium covae]MCJ1808595.1 hypothetical protein [Flavobacterium covae]